MSEQQGNSNKNVISFKGRVTGYAFMAKLGTKWNITDVIKKEVPEGFACLGYLGNKGVEPSRALSTKEIADMNGTVIATTTTSYKEKYKLTLMERSEAALKLAFGNLNYVEDKANNGFVVKHNQNFGVHHAFLFRFITNQTDDVIEYTDIYIPDGVVSAVGKMGLAANATYSCDVTISAMQDEAGNNAYEYTVKQPIVNTAAAVTSASADTTVSAGTSH